MVDTVEQSIELTGQKVVFRLSVVVHFYLDSCSGTGMIQVDEIFCPIPFDHCAEWL